MVAVHYRGRIASMRELVRDKTRDQLTTTLVSLGVTAKMADRGRFEERIGKPMFQRSLGIIDVSDGLIHWINIVKRDRSKDRRPAWRVVMGVPADRLASQRADVVLRTIRKKSFPIFGRVVDVTWKGDDQGLGLVHAFSTDMAVRSLATEQGNLEVRWNDNEFQGWTIIVDRRISPTMTGWQVLQGMAQQLLSVS
jgi:hypothetical protein